jgi:hypothetical protein
MDALPAYIELYKANLERFDRTRSIQWTFNGLFWSGVFLGCAFIGERQLDESDRYVLAILLITVGLLYTGIIILFQYSLSIDSKVFVLYRNEINASLKLTFPALPKVPGWIWVVFQIAITLMLLFILFHLSQKK